MKPVYLFSLSIWTYSEDMFLLGWYFYTVYLFQLHQTISDNQWFKMLRDIVYNAYRSRLSCLFPRPVLHLLKSSYIVLEVEVKPLFQSEIRPVKQCFSSITRIFMTIKTNISLVPILIHSILLEINWTTYRACLMKWINVFIILFK